MHKAAGMCYSDFREEKIINILRNRKKCARTLSVTVYYNNGQKEDTDGKLYDYGSSIDPA